MNWIDIFVIIIVILIFVLVGIYLVMNRKKSKCNSCPAVKRMKKNVLKAHKEIVNSHKE